MATVKKKSLFDHIKQITDVQNPNYWDEISDEDKPKATKKTDDVAAAFDDLFND